MCREVIKVDHEENKNKTKIRLSFFLLTTDRCCPQKRIDIKTMQ
jgi:hypothetical protein